MIIEKLNILEQGTIIDSETKEWVIRIREALKMYDECLGDTEMEVFLIHLAMADARRKQNDTSVQAMDDAFFKEVQEHEKYALSQQIYTELLSDKHFSEPEMTYIYLHLVNMLGGN
ncbi:PRD domain-containing protein [Granulicatella sp. zg-ZJ]|uniref:PRD domain-containing protein n=1 Tax=unclassified Granulicatella TaxID=2630493 RepID=UPI0013C1ED2C|nr:MULTISPECIES: PRD domain-containing protein [unclassified Granulicatella]MBS4750044.1 PRD domain-containing protein [Carnobacteriaceae bacterium zg-ZUI78]NEW62655.1 PRD domain-containing protein [Granulicatella sp. zg-ZJ]NEW65800.1 PRD domain-containing protein [Granulicatella sp. zg-84]QMI86305.1 PRD domain-containing protein [Carnobacteriaceae bacterium zg-84]